METKKEAEEGAVTKPSMYENISELATLHA